MPLRAGGLRNERCHLEAARVANMHQLPDAKQRLLDALETVDQSILPAVDTVNANAERQFDDESSSGYASGGAALLVGLITLPILVTGQTRLARRIRRWFSPLLLAATLLVVGFLALLVGSLGFRYSAIQDATGGGYDSIEQTATVQSDVFKLQSELGLQLLGAIPRADLTERQAAIEVGIEAITQAADSERERAVAEQLKARWERYEAEVDAVQALTTPEAANERFEGEAVGAFTGLNTTLDSVLSDNRGQFLDGLDRAATAVNLLPYAGTVLAVLAALATLLGVQRRLGEYR